MCGNLILTESRAIGSFYFIFLIYTIIWTLSRIVGKVCDNRYRDYAVRDYLKEHPSIKEYVVVDDDIKEYSSKDIPHLRLVDSKVGFR